MDERIIDVQCDINIKKNCAIKLDGVYCDGFHEHGSIGVFSHFHDDHIRAVHSCIQSYDRVITHPITFEAIDALKPGLRHRQQWLPQDYDTAYKIADITVRLLRANHIPGSSQVHVESGDKLLLYSGDFNYPDVQIRHADHLVIDSTHGDPWADGQHDRKSVMNRLFEHVMDNIDSKKHIVIQVTTGTLQEIVQHFEVTYGRKMPDDITFVMDKQQKHVLDKIYRDNTTDFRNIVDYGSLDFWNIIENNKKCVIFVAKTVLDDEIRDFYKIMIDRYIFSKDSTAMVSFEGGYRFNLASHASINGIYEYIEAVNPKYVITDNSRGKCGKKLAKLIEQKFPKIKTEYRPNY